MSPEVPRSVALANMWQTMRSLLVGLFFVSFRCACACVCVHSDTKIRVLAGHVFCAVFEATAGASYAMVGEASVATGVYLLDERTPHLTSSLYIVSVLSEIPLHI